jgi:ubiquitin carboxyl-terminal hydrolase 5/13
MTKLAIVEEREEDRYDHRTALRCWKCDPVDGRAIVVDDDTVRRCRRPRPLTHPCIGRRDA